MKRIISLILLILISAALVSALSACGSSAADDIDGIYMVSSGVILASPHKPSVKVYDRYGELIYSKLTKISEDDCPAVAKRVKEKDKLYLLDFAKLAETSPDGNYKCRFYAKNSKSYIEHTYIVSPSAAEAPEIFSAEATVENGIAALTVKTEPEYARLFKVWTDDIPEDMRFPSNALECVSGYGMLTEGTLLYNVPIAAGEKKTFVTRAAYHAYGYEGDDILMVDNSDYPDFVTPCICLDLLNGADDRVYNLGTYTHMSKFTIYPPSESTELATVLGTAPPPAPEPAVFTAELTAERGKARLKIAPYPNAVSYRAVINEECGGKTHTVFNKTLVGTTEAAADIRTDKEATYSGTVYATLTDGTMTEKLELAGFTTQFVQITEPEISYENGEVRAVFPKGADVTVWRSGAKISTATNIIGIKNVYTYFPDGKGEYGFIYKVKGNGADILDSGLIESKKVKVK